MRVCSIKVSNFSFDAGQYMHMHQISVVLGSVYGPAMTHLIWAKHGNMEQSMDLTGKEHIPAPRQAVWDALNNIETLKKSIPGCEDLERISDSEIRAALKVRLGVFKVRFHGMLELSNMNPPFSYTISGRGEGSIAGFAHGSTDVTLEENNGETVLSYAIRGDAGGKIAQLGTTLLGSVARKIADRFFANIAEAAAVDALSADRGLAISNPSDIN